MYIERFIERDFLKWKNQEMHGVLEVRGARQVGKTTAIEHFCRQKYKNIIIVNLASTDEDDFFNIVKMLKTKRVCAGTLDYLSTYAEQKGFSFSNDKNTVVFFDEIQESQLIYEMIRSFNRELCCDVIVTGSYLNKAVKYFQPAGDIDIMTMYPISFCEFINQFSANGHYKNWNNTKLHAKELEWLQKAYAVYCEIGGYPLAVVSYFKSGIKRSYEAHAKIFEMLQEELRNRMEDMYDYQKLQIVFESIIELLLKEKKGNSQYVSHLSRITEKIGTFRVSERECYNAIAWLKEAGIISFCNKKDLEDGRTFHNERLFFSDLGLLTYLCRKYKIADDVAEGMRNETFVFKSLNERDFNEEFYEDGPAFAIMRGYEVDFFVNAKDGCRYAIEVKTGKNNGKSVQQMQNTGKIDYTVYFKGKSNYGMVNNVITVPLALAYHFKYCFGKETESRDLASVEELQAFK